MYKPLKVKLSVGSPLHVRASEKQQAAYRAAAKRAKMTHSAWVRSVLDKAAAK